MYNASVPVLIHVLGNLSRILEKAADYASSLKIDPAVLVNSRLYPNMYPLSRQVQIATDMSKGCAARLAGQQPPSYADTETTIPDLQARLEKTIAYLRTFEPGQIDGSEDRTIELKVAGEPHRFPGLTYLQYYVLPNVYFHYTTAYNILRHNGMALSKGDFLGSV